MAVVVLDPDQPVVLVEECPGPRDAVAQGQPCLRVEQGLVLLDQAIDLVVGVGRLLQADVLERLPLDALSLQAGRDDVAVGVVVERRHVPKGVGDGDRAIEPVAYGGRDVRAPLDALLRHHGVLVRVIVELRGAGVRITLGACHLVEEVAFVVEIAGEVVGLVSADRLTLPQQCLVVVGVVFVLGDDDGGGRSILATLHVFLRFFLPVQRVVFEGRGVRQSAETHVRLIHARQEIVRVIDEVGLVVEPIGQVPDNLVELVPEERFGVAPRVGDLGDVPDGVAGKYGPEGEPRRIHRVALEVACRDAGGEVGEIVHAARGVGVLGHLAEGVVYPGLGDRLAPAAADPGRDGRGFESEEVPGRSLERARVGESPAVLVRGPEIPPAPFSAARRARARLAAVIRAVGPGLDDLALISPQGAGILCRLEPVGA